MPTLIVTEEDALFHYINSMSHKLVRLAEIYIFLLDNSDQLNAEEKEALLDIGKSLRRMQRSVSNLATVDLQNRTRELRDARTRLDEVLARLEAIVETINDINELLEIAGQVAEIAAGVAG